MARPKRGEILSLTIDDLAFGGEGVGRADGYVVFVPGGLPGDRLRVRLVQVRSRFGRGVIDAVEQPSPQRVEAPCPYFGRCGGCRLQHMAYPAQLAFKAKQVVDALERLGGLKGIEVRPIIGAELAHRTRPGELRAGTLTVMADNSPWLQELSMRSAEVLEAVRARFGPSVIALRLSLAGPAPVPDRPASRRAAPAAPLAACVIRS